MTSRKNIIICLVAVLSAMLAFSSCAPQAFVVTPEMRGPSKSGLNLAGKSIGLVYLTNDSTNDTTFNACFTSGFASRLEEDYFGGEEMVEIFKMPKNKKADQSCKDSLVNLVLDTGKDVVFLFDIPEFATPLCGEAVKVVGNKMPEDSSYLYTVGVPFTTKVYVYDSMNSEDKVLAFTGTKEMKPQVYAKQGAKSDELVKKAWKSIDKSANIAGNQAAGSFISTWSQDSFFVIYYDGPENYWDKASVYANSLKWDKAIEEWLKMADSKNAEKRACVAYDIALGCFMMGQPDLALEWLSRSDADMPVSLSKELRAKIEKYTGKK